MRRNGGFVIRTNEGFSLMTVIFVMVAMAIAGVAMISMMTRSGLVVEDSILSMRAFNTAQAGLEYISRKLKNDVNWLDNTAESMSFDGGTFSITYAALTADTATVRSTGSVDGAAQTVEQRMGVMPAAFLSVLYTKDDIKVTANSSVMLDGDLVTAGIVNSTGNSNYTVSGSVTEGYAQADVPAPDWTYWQSVADHTITGDYLFSEGEYNGIYYVTGNVRIENIGAFTLNGTIVSRGRVKISSVLNATIVARMGDPAIIAETDVHVDSTQALTVAGWVLALDAITFTSVSDLLIEGGLSAIGEIAMGSNNDVDIIYDADLIPLTGFGGGEHSDEIVRSSWREIL